MIKTIGKALAVCAVIMLAVGLPLAVSPPVAEASEDNHVYVDFATVNIHAASGDSITNGDFTTHEKAASASIGNEPDGSGEPVVGAMLTFMPGEGVEVLDWNWRFYREGSEYIWDLPDIGEGEGHDFSVSVAPDVPTLQPGFNAGLVFSNPGDPMDPDPLQFTGPGQLALQINTTPVSSMDELQIVVDAPFFQLVEANLVSVLGDGNINVSPDGKNIDIHIQEPDTTGTVTYTQNIVFDISLVNGVTDAAFKPATYIASWQGLGHAEDVIDTGVSRSVELGDWSWQTSGLYSWNWNERIGNVVYFAPIGNPPVNQVNASFESGLNVNVQEDSIANGEVEGIAWMNTDLHNQGDETGAPVSGPSAEGGPVLGLSIDPGHTIMHLEPEFSPVGLDEYVFGFHPINQDEGRHAFVEFGTELFEPGFSAVRIANATTFTTAGGTQLLTISVTTEEPMDRLAVNGQIRLNGQVNAHIVDIVLNFPEGYEWQGGYDPEGGFGYEVFNPDIGDTFEWNLTIVIDPIEGISGGIDYMPFIQVRNMNIINHEYVFGGSVEGVTAHGSWNWIVEGDYLWDWESRDVKEANFEGYANLLLDTGDIATEAHFHLTNWGLQLYDGEIAGCQEIFGNLFTFTHPQTPCQAQIASWSYVHEINKKGDGSISGAFVIEVHMDFEFGHIDGTIEVSFKADAYAVNHPFGGGEPFQYNFEGNFKIEGGTGFYEGISGSGSIGGTYHDQNFNGNPEPDPLEEWFDFVMIGNAKI